jgi:hypothetical protein
VLPRKQSSGIGIEQGNICVVAPSVHFRMLRRAPRHRAS